VGGPVGAAQPASAWTPKRLGQFGRLKAERAVRPIAVVVVGVLRQERAQVRLIERDDVVAALAPEGADHTLS
jgi:hypothetical protein